MMLRLLVIWLATAIFLGMIAWRLWRRGQLRFSALEAALFKRTPEGWTFDAPYPPFGRRRWTYLLTDAQKERLTEGLRLWMRTTPLLMIGLITLLAIPVAIWLPSPGDLLRWLLTRSRPEWLLLGLAFVLLYGTVGTAGFIAAKRWFQPVLRDARRIGLAGPISPFRLIADMTLVKELRRRIILNTVAFLASVNAACVAEYLSPSSPIAAARSLAAITERLAQLMDPIVWRTFSGTATFG
jgi:hypothetical protein